MHHAFFPRDGADGAPHYEGCHRDLGNWGKNLRGNISPETQQAFSVSVRTERDGEVVMKNMHLPVLVNNDKGKALHTGCGVHSSSGDPQVGVESPPGPQIQR